MNNINIIGNLTREPELRYTNGGMQILIISIAVNRREKSGEQWNDVAQYFDVKMIGKRAESVSKFLSKGSKIGVSGELRQETWEQDGQRRSKILIMANDIDLLSPKQTGGQQAKHEPGPTADQEYTDDIPF